MQHFTDEQILAQVDAALDEKPEQKVLAFLCNWCSYGGGDTAGGLRLKYPANIRFVRVMCSGRVDEDLILEAFEKGAALVLLSGCHIGDCHYISANQWTLRRADRLWNRLEKLGIRPERLQLEWISSAEGARFARVMNDLEEMRRKVTQEEIEYTKEVLTRQKLSVEETENSSGEHLESADV
jgi:heterodisulfide reductase subunit A